MDALIPADFIPLFKISETKLDDSTYEQLSELKLGAQTETIRQENLDLSYLDEFMLAIKADPKERYDFTEMTRFLIDIGVEFK